MSKPSGRLTCSTPELRAQLNLTNDHKKKESPYLQECPDASTLSHVMLKIVELRTLLGKVGRDCCRSFRLCSGILVKVVSPKYSGQLFNTHSTDVWNPEKRPSVSLYLDELLIQKRQFRGHFNVSIFSLERLSPRGSCHLDESSMNHTLAQKHLIELLMWNASNVQKHFNWTW